MELENLQISYLANTEGQFPTAEVNDFLEQLKELQASLAAYGVVAYDSSGTMEEQIAEMTEKLKISIDHPTPAPEAKNLIETLLQRCFLWVEVIKKK